MMQRAELNGGLLRSCVLHLRSRAFDEVCEGAVLAAYIIEQVVKSELRATNPLLYFDRTRNNLTAALEARIGAGLASTEETSNLKTSTARWALEQICEIHATLRIHKGTVGELLDIRNHIIHSTDDIPFDIHAVAETSASALRAFKDLIAKHSGAFSGDLTPHSLREIEAIQEEESRARLLNLKEKIAAHAIRYGSLEKKLITERMISRKPITDSMLWIDGTFECPACHQVALDCVTSVDFEEGDEGETVAYGGSSYKCRICELELSGHEAGMARHHDLLTPDSTPSPEEE